MMRITFSIAKTELQDLFYSPVAWLILIVFSFQSGNIMRDLIDEIVKTQSIGYYDTFVTLYIYGGWFGLLVKVQSYLYLYIPILTMGMMSRELSSGSIKLLYSSPIKNTHIVLGKYMGMLLFGLVLMSVLIIYAIYGMVLIDNVEAPMILSGLLGIFLLLCTYIAIGLFVSSLTSYQIVAAIGTLAVLAALGYVGKLWQHIDLIREITYWLDISGRASNFMQGLITSEDIIYFLTVIFLFLGMTLIRMQLRRQRVSLLGICGKIVCVFAIVIIVVFVSSYPKCKFYNDVTYTQKNTITTNSQNVVKQLSDELKIITYVNILDQSALHVLTGYSEDVRRFEKYTRFKPDIKQEYVYYYVDVKNPLLEVLYPETTLAEKAEKIIEKYSLNPEAVLTPEQINEQIDLSGEGYKLVRLLQKESGEKVFLRIYNDSEIFPFESEISVALKKLITSKLPVVGFLAGHGERGIEQYSERSYTGFTRVKNVRQALINQGFDFKSITLEEEIPDEVNILVIAEMRTPMADDEYQRLVRYVESGGHVMLIGDVGHQKIANIVGDLFGVKFIDGYLIQPDKSKCPRGQVKSKGGVNNESVKPLDLIMLRPTQESVNISYIFGKTGPSFITLPKAVGLDYTHAGDKHFKVTPLLMTDTTCWNELQTEDLVNEVVEYNPEFGEEKKAYAVGLALSRKIGDREQKVVVLGDADCLSNADIARARAGRQVSNYELALGAFHWMSDGEFPIDVRRPVAIDRKLNLTEDGWRIFKYFVVGGIPCVLLVLAFGIWFRRRRY